MSDKLPIWNGRMLKLMEYCVKNGISDNQSDWLRAIDIAPPNLNKLKTGERGFTPEQIRAAGVRFNASMEYIFGFSSSMFRKDENKTALDILKEAVSLVERDIQEDRDKKKAQTKAQTKKQKI